MEKYALSQKVESLTARELFLHRSNLNLTEENKRLDSEIAQLSFEKEHDSDDDFMSLSESKSK